MYFLCKKCKEATRHRQGISWKELIDYKYYSRVDTITEYTCCKCNTTTTYPKDRPRIEADTD